MSGTFQIKRGDTSPGIKYELLPSDINLSGATVRFQMQSLSRQTIIDAPAVIEQTTAPPIVSYAWASGDTEKAGNYRAEFRVEYADGSIETFPNKGFINLKVNPDVQDLP